MCVLEYIHSQTMNPKIYMSIYKANLRFLEYVPKDKRFSKERQFYIRSAANAKRAINRLTLKGE